MYKVVRASTFTAEEAARILIETERILNSYRLSKEDFMIACFSKKAVEAPFPKDKDEGDKNG